MGTVVSSVISHQVFVFLNKEYNFVVVNSFFVYGNKLEASSIMKLCLVLFSLLCLLYGSAVPVSSLKLTHQMKVGDSQQANRYLESIVKDYQSRRQARYVDSIVKDYQSRILQQAVYNKHQEKTAESKADRIKSILDDYLSEADYKKDLHENPDARKNTSELIASEGYTSEEHTVNTTDGFLLRLYRIPAGRGNVNLDPTTPRPAVLLQHGLLSSSCDWVMNFAEGSLAFVLADAGYDVWMGNSRGNTESRRHESLSPEDEKFWDWSFDEMAEYDLTAFIDFVLSKTDQSSLYYVGHSQGTTMAFALLSKRPDYHEKIKLFVALAPVANIAHAKSPVVYLSSIPDNVLFKVFGRKSFLAGNFFIDSLIDVVCQDVATRWVCSNVLFLIAGPDYVNLNKSRMAVYVSHTPAGSSTKNLIHFAQIFRNNQFQKFDYGSPDENMKRYNQTTPPVYDVSQVNVPVLAFTAPRDWLADAEDTANLLGSLPNLQFQVDVRGWNHLDLVWGKDAAHYCYHPMVDWFKKFT